MSGIEPSFSRQDLGPGLEPNLALRAPGARSFQVRFLPSLRHAPLIARYGTRTRFAKLAGKGSLMASGVRTNSVQDLSRVKVLAADRKQEVALMVRFRKESD
jgi:hypothetical protein